MERVQTWELEDFVLVLAHHLRHFSALYLFQMKGTELFFTCCFYWISVGGESLLKFLTSLSPSLFMAI